MRLRPLPIIEQLKAMDNDEAARFVRASIQEVLLTPGFQLFLGGIQSIEANSMAALKVGLKPDFQLGRLAAFEQLRDYLRQLKAPVPALEAEVEEDLLPPYESGFLVKPRTDLEHMPPADLSPLPEEPAE